MTNELAVDVDTLREQVREKYREWRSHLTPSTTSTPAVHSRASSATTPRLSTLCPIGLLRARNPMGCDGRPRGQ